MSGYEGQKEDEVDEKVVDKAPNEGEDLTERVSEEDMGAWGTIDHCLILNDICSAIDWGEDLLLSSLAV